MEITKCSLRTPVDKVCERSLTMDTIMRGSTEVELDGPPAFEYGDKVRSRKVIRNDGTFAGKETGDCLARKGEVGYVTSIGTYLQQFYIYGVEFIDSGYRVGMKRNELELANEEP
jgi:nitrogen fixation protein NifZ